MGSARNPPPAALAKKYKDVFQGSKIGPKNKMFEAFFMSGGNYTRMMVRLEIKSSYHPRVSSSKNLRESF